MIIDMKNSLRKVLILIAAPILVTILIPMVWYVAIRDTIKSIFLAIDNGR